MIGGGAPRTPNPIDRRAIQRQAQTQRPPENLRGAAEVDNRLPQLAPQASYPQDKKSSNRYKIGLIVVAALLVASILGLLIWMSLSGGMSSLVHKDKYQAVFLSNGQVYFGKLESSSQDHMTLTNVFYVQSDGQPATNEESTEQGSDSNSLKLVKLGDEPHGPEDEMFINRDQVLFYENLKPDGKVSELIKSYQPGNN